MICRTLTIASLGLLGVSLAGCMSSGDLAERSSLAEAGMLEQQGVRKNAFGRYYRYYPEEQVYHSAWQDKYFWMEAQSRWKSGRELPSDLDVTDSEYEMVKLFSAKPWKTHDSMLALYPPTPTLSTEVDEAWVSVPTD